MTNDLPAPREGRAFATPRNAAQLSERLEASFSVAWKLRHARTKRSRARKEFATGWFWGILQTLRAVGYAEWANKALRDIGPEHNRELELFLRAGDRWLGRGV